jgi:hypothetical protein
MNKKDAELSPLARQLLQNSGAQQFFTQKEFDEALALAQAEIMQVAIETTKQAIYIERQACAEVVEDWNGEKDLKQLAEAIRNRIPTQRLQ